MYMKTVSSATVPVILIIYTFRLKLICCNLLSVHNTVAVLFSFHYAKSPPSVIFTASRRQSFSFLKSTSSRQSSHILHQSVIFVHSTDSGD